MLLYKQATSVTGIRCKDRAALDHPLQYWVISHEKSLRGSENLVVLDCNVTFL